MSVTGTTGDTVSSGLIYLSDYNITVWSILFCGMNRNVRSGIMRIVVDMVKADGIIDTKEMTAMHKVMSKYGLTSADCASSDAVTLQQAVEAILNDSPKLATDVLGDIMNLAMSDNICAREEALLFMGLNGVFNPDINSQTGIISVASTIDFLSDNQIIYVESKHDASVNKIIESNYTEIVSLFRLSGFDFIYIPKIVEHYEMLSDEELLHLLYFLYPMTGKEKLMQAAKQLKTFSTVQFCHDLLSAKFNISSVDDTPPAFMMKIGSSITANKPYNNYLLIETDDDVLKTVKSFTDYFNTLYKTVTLDYLHEERGRFIYRGFYRQLLELLLLRKGVKSNVLIDTMKCEIEFPEAGVRIEKLHRREKALYALFLIESPSGGINFTRPSGVRAIEHYEHRMEVVQRKYGLIYEKFGGDRKTAPNISMAETRLPMISLIKRQVTKLDSVLYHANDYIIQRNIYGNYGMHLQSGSCLCRGYDDDVVRPIEESEEWRSIIAL